jgi:crossover junction endodeoxyribonuclease RuvC
MRWFGGIDNGKDGGLVIMREDGAQIEGWVMPTFDDGIDMVELLRVLREEWLSLTRALRPSALFVVLEKAQSMPKQGVASSFKYGRGYGAAEMALISLQIPYQLVPPLTWQKPMLHGMPGSDTKARSVNKCRQALPTLDLMPGRRRKPHDGLADAACMALFARQLQLGAAPRVVAPAPAHTSTPPLAALPPVPPAPRRA